MQREDPTWDGPYYGEFGTLADNGQHVQCHVCGKWFHHMAMHINAKHGLNADAYRSAFGLTQNTKLASQPYREKRRELHADMMRELGKEHRERIRNLTTEERKQWMAKAPRRLGYEQRISGPGRTEAALRHHFGDPEGYGEQFWAQIAADFVEEAKGGRGVYGRLSREWGVAMNTAQMRVKAAVDKGLLELTGRPFSPAGRLSSRAKEILRNRSD